MCSARSLQLPRASLCPFTSFTIKNQGVKGVVVVMHLGFQKSCFSLGARAIFLSFCGRALARKRKETRVQRVDFALGLISRAVRPGLSAGAGLVEGQKGTYLSDCHEIAWKAACGNGGEPSAPALGDPPRRQVKRQGQDHLD